MKKRRRRNTISTCVGIGRGLKSSSAIDTYRKNGYDDEGRGFGIVFFYSCLHSHGISVEESILRERERERKETRPYNVSKASIECIGLW